MKGGATSDLRKIFGKMSKRVDAKRHRYEAARVSGPITNKNKVKRGKAK